MPFKVTIDDSQTHPSILLSDTTANTQAEIFCFGGLLNSFCIEKDGELLNIVDAYKSVDDAIAQKNTWFKSCKLSPFACRLSNGKFEFENTKYKIDKFYLGKNAMHGMVYDAIYNIAETQATEDFAMVELMYEYKREDKGYPFAFNIKLVWKLEANNKLSITSIIENKTNINIPYCEGWHPYFKLDAPVDNCTLQFDANEMLELDENLIPTGNFVLNERFTSPTLLKNINLDNCFLLSNIEQPKCVLKGKQLQLTITPDKAYPYLQIFTPDHRENIAVENLSAAPDAFNNKIGLLMLEPSKQYHFTTSYQIEFI